MKKPVIIGLAFLVVVLGVLIYSSMDLSTYKVEVCVEFSGRSTCKVASGTTEEFALRTAITNACGVIASGVTETLACQGAPPKSITWAKRGK